MHRGTMLVAAAVLLCISGPESVFSSSTIYRNVGGVRLILPAPEGFTDDCARSQVLSRLIAAMSEGDLEVLASYLTVTDCQVYLGGASTEWFSPYLLVQVDRRVKDQELSQANFAEVRRIFRSEHANTFDRLRPELRSLLESPTKALSDSAGANVALAVGEMVPLGVFAESSSSLSATMLMKVRLTLGKNTEEILQVCTTSLVFVRSRILFLYAYRTYRGDDDIKSLKLLTSRWVDQILAAN